MLALLIPVTWDDRRDRRCTKLLLLLLLLRAAILCPFVQHHCCTWSSTEWQTERRWRWTKNKLSAMRQRRQTRSRCSPMESHSLRSHCRIYIHRIAKRKIDTGPSLRATASAIMRAEAVLLHIMSNRLRFVLAPRELASPCGVPVRAVAHFSRESLICSAGCITIIWIDFFFFFY